MLGTEAGAKRIEVDAGTLGAALEALPVRDLLLDERGVMRPLVHAYVDGQRELDLGRELGPGAEVILVAAVAGGSRETS